MLAELRRHPKAWTIVGVGLIALVLLLALLRALDRAVIVAFLDVGQGDAVFIQGPNGNQLLYDAGPPSGAVLRELGRMMPIWDRSIDVLVMSHPDLDHSGGIPDVLRRYNVDLLLEPGKFSGNGAYDAVRDAVKNQDVHLMEARGGMRVELGSGAYADILYPYPDEDVSHLDPNDASVVLRFVYGNTSVLLSGDLPTALESRLALRYGNALRSDILKLGHHGSRTSSGPLWLSAVRPRIAIISAGAENRYGHPHQEVLKRLELGDIPYLLTANEGSIVFHLNSADFQRER
jgi:competence protein ComEC